MKAIGFLTNGRFGKTTPQALSMSSQESYNDNFSLDRFSTLPETFVFPLARNAKSQKRLFFIFPKTGKESAVHFYVLLFFVVLKAENTVGNILYFVI